jgi:hypothetical protein
MKRYGPTGVQLILRIFVLGEGRQWPEMALRVAREAMIGSGEKNALRQCRA